MSITRLALFAAVAAAAAAGTAAAASVPGPPSVTASVDGGHVASPRAIVVNGTITCTKNAHFHLNAWVEQADRGGLGKGSLPPKAPPGLSAKKAKLLADHWHTLTACTGGAMPWTLLFPAVGAHPAGFAAGTTHVCVIAYAGKGHLYSLFASCADVTVS